jgi:transcriptional regulator with XRE-family HTH domain
MYLIELSKIANNSRRWALSLGRIQRAVCMGLMQNVAANVRRLLAERGITGSEFARQVGVEPSVMSRWLNCKVTPLVQNIEKMAAILGVPVESLTQNPDTPKFQMSDREILEILDFLKKQGRDVYDLAEKISASRKPKKK